MRIVFAGTPEFAAVHLSALIASGHQLVGVLTQPDRPAGRGQKLTPSPVKLVAEQYDLPLAQPQSLKPIEAQQVLAAWQPDLLVVVAYGLLLPKAVLELPRYGCINVHGSLLPRWRGAAPIQRAIEAGDAETGVTIMQMDEGLDTGAMLLKAHCPINASDTSASIFTTLSQLGPEALIAAIAGLKQGSLVAEPQDHSQATYATKLSKDEGLLDWQQPAAVLERRIRAFWPWPGTAFGHQGWRIKVSNATVSSGLGQPGTILKADSQRLEIACAEGSLCFSELQLPGKKSQPLADIINGHPQLFIAGQQLDGRHE